MTAVWGCIWKTSAATLAVWIITLLLRRRSAALRHGLWLCALAAFILVPALLPLAGRTPPVRLAIHARSVFGTALVPIAATIPIAAPIPVAASRAKPSIALPIDRFLQWLWLSGSLVLFIRRGRAVFRMQQIAGRSTPAPESIDDRDAPSIRISDEVRTPLTWGLTNPMILLPPCALDWSDACLASVLEHEREHIRRFDSLSHWLAELVCVGWWFHPCAWLARGRAAYERECACDDAVIRSGVRPTDYASELLGLASTLASTLSIKGEPMALSALSNFERRIRNLLLPDIDRRPANTRARLAIALAAIVVIIPLGVLRAQAPAGQADLSGTVTDPTGARVPRARITAFGSGGNREVTAANAVGEWSFSGIPAGNYTVEAAAPGFALARNSVELTAGQQATLPQSLTVGSVQMTIKVTGQGQARTALAQSTAAQSTAASEPVRIGGMVQAANLIRQVKPAYPPGPRAQGIEGTVLLNAVIGKDGNMLSVVVANKLVDPDLAAAALAAVKQWQFKPTLLNGEPVEVFTTVTVAYTLM